MKQLILTAILALFAGTGAAFATDNAAGSPYQPYTCEPNDVGVETCYCAGRYDCAVMEASGVCDVPMPDLGSNATGNDTSCDADFGGVGEYVCECSAEQVRPEPSRRPDAFNAPTDNAPADRSEGRRGRRGFEELPDGTSNTLVPAERGTETNNEVVPARRGTARETEGVEEAEETAPPARTVRDHR